VEVPLGEGGMGTVYRTTDTKLNRHVAIKLLLDEFADVAARQRFQREAQLASSLNHPHILTVYDVVSIKAASKLSPSSSMGDAQGLDQGGETHHSANRGVTDWSRRRIGGRTRGQDNLSRHQTSEHSYREERLREAG
jgi:serine/threonine protein kinase